MNIATLQADIDGGAMTLPEPKKVRRRRPSRLARLVCPGCGHPLRIAYDHDPDRQLEYHTEHACRRPDRVIMTRIQVRQLNRARKNGKMPDPKNPKNHFDEPDTPRNRT